MKTTLQSPQKKSDFIRLPLKWARRKDLSPAFKIIVGYINTRSTAKLTNGMAWTISAADIMYQTGLSKSVVYKTIKILVKADILFLIGTKKGKFNDYQIYKINRQNLLTYLKVSPQKELALVLKKNQGLSLKRTVQEDKQLEQDKKEEHANAYGSDTSENNLVVGNYQGANPPAAGFSDLGVTYQSVPPAPSLIQGATAVPLRSANQVVQYQTFRNDIKTTLPPPAEWTATHKEIYLSLLTYHGLTKSSADYVLSDLTQNDFWKRPVEKQI
jgi:hypothetical protein